MPQKKSWISNPSGEVGTITDTRACKRRLVKERTEAGAENEFCARSSGKSFFHYYFIIILYFDVHTYFRFKIESRRSTVTSGVSALQSLTTLAKVLASLCLIAKILSAPLPQRTQDFERLDRHAAYEQTKEVDKWSETM